jgi:FdhD protein
MAGRTPPSAVARRQVHRWQPENVLRKTTDDLAVEEPLEIQIDTRPAVVTMRTPGHDNELAAGLLLTEGLIRQPGDIVRIRPNPRSRTGNSVQVFLHPDVRADLSRLARHNYAVSSCGLCGKTSLKALRQRLPRIQTEFVLAPQSLLKAAGRLHSAQATFSKTGGLHAAAICDGEGGFVVVREDIGRHNAVDKVVGHGALHGLWPFERHFLLVSGRASFEIVQKALAARIPIVAAVSAPSSLAVDLAADSGITLVGFLREQRMNVYTHASRIARSL